MIRLEGAKTSGGQSLSMCSSMALPRSPPRMCRRCLLWPGPGKGPGEEVNTYHQY